jgi:serine/threonine-protein kinase
MSLPSGSRLGPYEVVALLGVGGMGEVYRAHDPRLARDVALKVLPEAFASDADRLARFKREAQVLAALSHPNIAGIHGFEESDGVRALVLELVDGPTLADRIARGPIAIDEALPLARQIADALEAAHEQGIVHRDLKPANIKIAPNGQVKVLDFGLAKMLEAEAAPAALTMSPTLSVQATLAGVILGTAAYMSPEQARGKAVDRRTDIWAFGCVLFEMLTGQPAFEPGETVSDAIAAILTREPDLTALPAATPPYIRILIKRCLQKDPQRRLPHIGLARLEIDDPPATPSVSPPAAVKPASSRQALLAGIVSALVAASSAGAAVWYFTRPQVVAPPVIRLHATPVGDVLNVNPFDPDIAVSPDGERIAFMARAAGLGTPRILVRSLAQKDAVPLAGTETARGLFFSPDGQWIGYAQNNDLKKISVNGGPSVMVCQQCAAGFRGASWGPDDSIVFSANAGNILRRVAAAGGEVSVVVPPEGGLYTFPEVLPDGRTVLFTLSTGPDSAQIVARNLEGGEPRVIVRGGSHARYVSTGHLVYAVAGTLRAVAFNAETLEVAGNPSPVLDGVVTKGTGAADFAVARDGLLVYVSGEARGSQQTVAWVDRQGRQEMIGVPPRSYAAVRLAPDSRRIALEARDQQADIWLWDSGPRLFTRFTFDPGLEQSAVWSPDSDRLAFAGTADGVPNLFWKTATAPSAERLTQSPVNQVPYAFTPDGKWLIAREDDPKTGSDLILVSMEGERVVKPLLRSPFNESNADLSPDGRWLAYQSNDSGRDEVYVRPFPAVETGRWQIISSNGATRPLWARSGRELFYVDQIGRLMAVPVDLSGGFSAGNPTPIVEGVAPLFAGRGYDASPDARRFLVIRDAAPDAAAPPPQLHVVLNWGEELKRLVPIKH